jgi:hypothetical protein
MVSQHNLSMGKNIRQKYRARYAVLISAWKLCITLMAAATAAACASTCETGSVSVKGVEDMVRVVDQSKTPSGVGCTVEVEESPGKQGRRRTRTGARRRKRTQISSRELLNAKGAGRPAVSGPECIHGGEGFAHTMSDQVRFTSKPR